MARHSKQNSTRSSGLSDQDTARLNSFMPEIASALCPGKQVAMQANGETRVGGSSGALVIYPDHRWWSFSAGQGGKGALSLLRYLLGHAAQAASVSEAEALAYAGQWLAEHSGAGGAPTLTEAELEARAQARKAHIQTLRQAAQAVIGTPAEVYLTSRNLPPPYPKTLAYVPDARPDQAEGALLVLLHNSEGKETAGHLVHLDPSGRKSAYDPVKQTFNLVDRKAAADAAFRIAPEPVPAGTTGFTRTIVTEGVEDGLSCRIACPHATIIAVPGISRLPRLGRLPGVVVVVRDGDTKDSAADQALTSGVDTLILAGTLVLVTETPQDEDANSILCKLGPDALRVLIEGAKEAKLSRAGDITRLARLDALDYAAERKAAAKVWGLSTVKALDQAVEAERVKVRVEGGRSSEEQPAETVWHEAITDLSEVLDEALAAVRKHVRVEEHWAAAACVWALHTHLVHRDDLLIPITPRLFFQGVAPNCGKSTALGIVRLMSQRSMLVLSTTGAAFFRLNDAIKPTLLLDEADKSFANGRGDDLLQMINGGHQRGFAEVHRVEEVDGKREVMNYDAWGAVALAGIGDLPAATTQSRCIRIMMRRLAPGETVEHIKRGHSPALDAARQKYARWAADLKQLPDITLPPELTNRAGDNWEVLLQLAALAGPRWHALIEKAALDDAGREGPVDGALPLLADLRTVFGAKDRLTTQEITRALVGLEEPSGEWGRCNRGGPVTPYYLRRALKDLLDPPGSQQWKRPSSRQNVHGYLASQLQDAFSRYLPAAASAENTKNKTPNPSDPSGTTHKKARKSSGFHGPGSEKTSGTNGIASGTTSDAAPAAEFGPGCSEVSGTTSGTKSPQSSTQDFRMVPDGPDGSDGSGEFSRALSAEGFREWEEMFGRADPAPLEPSGQKDVQPKGAANSNAHVKGRRKLNGQHPPAAAGSPEDAAPLGPKRFTL
jgi:hypothetical protein